MREERECERGIERLASDAQTHRRRGRRREFRFSPLFPLLYLSSPLLPPTEKCNRRSLSGGKRASRHGVPTEDGKWSGDLKKICGVKKVDSFLIDEKNIFF